jgi:hypothetical protein
MKLGKIIEIDTHLFVFIFVISYYHIIIIVFSYVNQDHNMFKMKFEPSPLQSQDKVTIQSPPHGITKKIIMEYINMQSFLFFHIITLLCN